MEVIKIEHDSENGGIIHLETDRGVETFDLTPDGRIHSGTPIPTSHPFRKIINDALALWQLSGKPTTLRWEGD